MTSADPMNPAFPPSLASVAKALQDRGVSLEDAAATLATVGESPLTQEPIVAMRRQLEQNGVAVEAGAVERVLLIFAARASEPRIEKLAVHASVKRMIRDEFRSFSKPGPRADLRAPGSAFGSTAKLATLRRFPAGPMDWEISGVPRSWLLKVPKSDLPGLLGLLWRVGGFRPFFHMHVGLRPRNRSLLIEKEVLRYYYRMARSLELQPEVRGIMATAWFHDPRAVAQNPHLEWINRPYIEAGGWITTIGPAPADSGFAERNPAREQLNKRGELNYRIGLAIWPKEAAISWASRHPEFET